MLTESFRGFGVAQAIFSFVGSFSFSLVGFHASLGLFSSALHSVLGSPMSFFDTTPLGRIISRLSKDIDTYVLPFVGLVEMLMFSSAGLQARFPAS